MRSPTIVDIAREAGVAFKTVSRVINGEASVKKETRERVEAVIARLGYKPNVWARSLRRRRTNSIAMLFMPTSARSPSEGGAANEENLAVSSYYNQIQVNAMATCQDAGYHLFVEQLQSQPREIGKHIRKFVEKTELDGVLLTPPLSDNPAVVKVLKEAEIPFVRVSPYTQLRTSSYAYIDDRKAAYELTRHLIGLGHRDIAFVKGPPDHLSSKARYLGFCGAMEEGRIAVRPEWVIASAFSMRYGAQAADKLLSGKRHPTAVLCFNDDIAAGVMTTAYRKGLVLPRDLSIGGFDNSPIAGALWPALTTIHQPVSELARAATQVLIREIESFTGFSVLKLDYKLIVRESTAPAHA